MKQLTKEQRLFVTRTAETEVAKHLLSVMESGITAAQWPTCDEGIVAVIVKCFKAGGVTLLVKHSQRTRPGWSKVTFDAEYDKDAVNARKVLERARVKVEKNGGYVVEAAKKDKVALLLARQAKIDAEYAKLTPKQQARFDAAR